MHLTSFSVENYRCFASGVTVPLRPLTLLYGPNGSGKSALLRALPLMARGTEAAPLSLADPASGDAEVEEVRCRSARAAAVQLGLAGQGEEESVWARFWIEDVHGQPALTSFATRGLDPPRWAAHGAWRPGAGWALTLRQEDRELPLAIEAPLRFTGLRPDLDSVPRPFRRAVGALHSLLSTLSRQLQWLGPARAPLARRTLWRGAALGGLGGDGGGVVEALAADQAAGGDLLERVAVGALSGRGQISLKREGDALRLVNSPTHAPGVTIDLCDAGEGVQQSLPVQVALARAARRGAHDPTLLALEQPERGLHAGAVLALGRQLAELASLPRPPTLLVETHASALLLAVQFAVAEGHLDPSRVGLLWARPLDAGHSALEAVPLDGSGRPLGWPGGAEASSFSASSASSS